jgi:hypothetical protein
MPAAACSDTDTPCYNQVPAEIALKIVSKIKVSPAECVAGGRKQPPHHRATFAHVPSAWQTLPKHSMTVTHKHKEQSRQQ